MRGKKARALRKAVPPMPPALKRAMKAEIAAHAAKRADRVGKSHRVRNEQIAAARLADNARCDEAYREFEKQRAEIVADYAKQAAAVVEAVAA